MSEGHGWIRFVRFRLYPTTSQQADLLGHCAHARYVWNLAVEQWGMWRRWQGPTPGYSAQAAQLTEARAAEPWLAAGSQTVQQQALRDFDQARRNYHAGTHRRPTWRRRGQNEGFRIVGPQAQRVERVNRRWGRMLVPKVGWVRFRLTRPLSDDAKSYRVTRDRAGRWHVGFAVIPDPIPAPGNGEVVGVDRGVAVSAALSTGEMLNVAVLTLREMTRLYRLQQRLARARKGSNRRHRVKAAIARLRARERDRRKEWVETTTTDLARRFDVIRVEDLRIANMTRSARGTVERPGRGVRQKAGLNRSILAQGWGQLVERLRHKAMGRVEVVSAPYTSLTCNVCGHCAPGNRESQAVFRCAACGHTAHADINAARNIAAGRAVTARRAENLSAMKREPQRLAS